VAPQQPSQSYQSQGAYPGAGPQDAGQTRSSTKVQYAPGGQSQVVFGDDGSGATDDGKKKHSKRGGYGQSNKSQIDFNGNNTAAPQAKAQYAQYNSQKAHVNIFGPDEQQPQTPQQQQPVPLNMSAGPGQGQPDQAPSDRTVRGGASGNRKNQTQIAFGDEQSQVQPQQRNTSVRVANPPGGRGSGNLISWS